MQKGTTPRRAPHCHAHHPPPQAKHLYVLLHPYRRDRTILAQTLCSEATPKSHPFSPWVGCSHTCPSRSRTYTTPAAPPFSHARRGTRPPSLPRVSHPAAKRIDAEWGAALPSPKQKSPTTKARALQTFRAYLRLLRLLLLFPRGPMRVPHTCTPTPDHTN